MSESVQTKWLGHMAFESTIDQFVIPMDADEKSGGTNSGPRPKPMLLSALAGCTGMDVISILEKKKVIPASFDISVLGTMTEEHPKYYQKIHIIYKFTGDHFSGNEEILIKINRAIQLSREKYCGVSAMLQNSCEITHEVILADS
jgi:putative redox protein